MIETRVDGRLVDRLPAADVAARRWGAGLLWVNGVAPDDAELAYLADAFHLHPLAVEDLIHRNQRPKVDQYDDQLLIVVFGVAQADGHGIELSELHVVVGPEYVVTVSDRELPTIAAIGERCQVRPELAAGAEGQLVYRLLDALVDSFFPILDQLDGDLDQLETKIVERADVTVVSDIFDLKRDLNLMRRILGPQRDLLQGLAGPHGPALGAEAQLYLRDVYDHAVRIVEQVDAYRDIVTGALDVYLSSVSNRLGEQTRRLSVVATIFLPLTFFTGFFGQNFGFLIERVSSATAFAVGISVEIVSVALIWFMVRRVTASAHPRAVSAARAGRRRLLRSYTRRRPGSAREDL